ncbi:MAG: hypothetical protein IIX61_04115 [Loktanella sp.]|nr:hypothetical protein [Loktanella sp.]
MRDHVPDEDCDIERMVALIGAPPAAPMQVVRQQLERDTRITVLRLLPRLRGSVSPKVGQ